MMWAVYSEGVCLVAFRHSVFVVYRCSISRAANGCAAGLVCLNRGIQVMSRMMVPSPLFTSLKDPLVLGGKSSSSE